MTAGLLLTDPVALGPYRLLGRLGGGGMGQVFLAESPEGLAAVKVIRPDLAADADFRKRFAREVAAARKVSGAYTAVLIDADTEGALPWLATAYIAGPPLSAVVRDIGPLPPASLRPLAAGLVEALRTIHAAGVVHRDLKPSNVLLADDGPRVIDFGISHAVEASTMTESGAILGSPGYMSPEQAQGHHVGPASDVFSLGALLAYAATGAVPFGDGPVAALVYRVVNAEPDLDRVPAEFSPLIERCLAKVPDKRPGLDDLLSELGGEPIQGDWLPAAVTRTFPRYAPAARIAAMPVPEPPPAPEPSPAETPATGTPAAEISVPETPAPETETPAGAGTASPARRRLQLKRRQQGAVIAVAVAVVVGMASWLVLGTGGGRPSGDPAAALPTRPASSAGTSAAANDRHAKNPSQRGSHASPVTSPQPTPPPSPAPAVTVQPDTPAPSRSPTPSASPAPTASAISGVSADDDASAIAASEVSVQFGGCTAWLDNDGSGNLSGMLNTSLYQSCDAEVYGSEGPIVSLSASWGAERTSALSDTGRTMWICVWPAGDQSGQQCSPPFAMNGGTPTQT